MQTLKFYIDQDYEEPDKFVPMDEKTRHLFAILGVEKATLEQINSVFNGATFRLRDQKGEATKPFTQQFGVLIWRDKSQAKFFGTECSPQGHWVGDTLSGTNITALHIKLTDRKMSANKQYKNVNN